MTEPGASLLALAALLREEESVISPAVRPPEDGEAVHGLLAAAGPRAAGSPGEYALIVEAVREGYLLHHGAGRVVRDADPDLALLAGDYLYALGLERLAALGDLIAVRELADLISLASAIHDGERAPERASQEAAALWIASACAVGAEPGAGHAGAKAALRAGSPEATGALLGAARETAGRAGFGEAVERAVFSIDFAADQGS